MSRVDEFYRTIVNSPDDIAEIAADFELAKNLAAVDLTLRDIAERINDVVEKNFPGIEPTFTKQDVLKFIQGDKNGKDLKEMVKSKGW